MSIHYPPYIRHFIFVLFMIAGCGEPPKVITSNDFGTAELGPFVESEFPFITGPLDAGKPGSGFPGANLSARTLSIKLGDSTYVGFDTDLLRWSAAWEGEFLPMVTMAQVSYADFFNKHDKIPRISGNLKIATGEYPGWTVDTPGFNDPRNPLPPTAPDSRTYGPISENIGRWNGAYVNGNAVGLHYTVGGANIIEKPGGIRFGDQVAFVRALEISELRRPLYLHIAETATGSDHETVGSVLYTYHGAGRDSVTAVAVVGADSDGVQPAIHGDRHISVLFPNTRTQLSASVVIWRGPTSRMQAFSAVCRNVKTGMPDFRKGGAAYWKEPVYTQGMLSPDTAAYVTDVLTLPLPNPWKRNVRVADVAFFDDGRAALVTFSGDVWIVEGIDKKLKRLKWSRFASGLYEPMSIEIVDGLIYTFGKEGIVRLHDLNNDGMADYYENFCNKMEQSLSSREWAGDMVLAPDGGFYIAKGGIAGSRQRGSVMKVSSDGRHIETIATGLRGPYLGIHPSNGILSASDQQGNYVPSTPIMLVSKGDYFGFPTTPDAHHTPIKKPLTWIPHKVDRSGISQTWITGGKMGPLNESMIHFSFARPGLFKVLIDSTSGGLQGGVSFLRADYPAPTQKGTIHPDDGQLYITGFNLWGSSSTGVAAFLRLRYTGLPFYSPERFKAGEQGVFVRFGVELDAASVNPSNFKVKRWNYKRTSKYGSGHYKLDGTPGEEPLPVSASLLSPDRKGVWVVVPDMKEVMQMELAYALKAADGTPMDDGLWFTVNEVRKMDLASEGFDKPVDIAALTAENAAKQPVDTEISAKKGARLFEAAACSGCHSPGLETKGFYGPPFSGLFGSVRHFEDGTSAIADEAYIRESVWNASKKIVKGYDAEMPSYVGILSDEDIASLILYIKSL